MTKRTTIKGFLLTALLFSAVLLQAQEQPSPTEGRESGQVLILDEHIVESMVYSSFTYQNAKTLFNQAKRTRNSSMWNWLLPSVSGFGTLTNSKPLATDSNTNGTGSNLTDGKWVSNIGIKVDLTISAWVEMEILKALSDYQSGAITFEQSKAKAVNTAKLAFYSLIEKENALRVSQSNVDVMRTTYNQTLGMFNSGLVDRVTMLQSQLGYQSALNSYNSDQATYDGDILSFKQLLGIDLNQKIALEGNIDIIPGYYNGDLIAADYLGKAYDVAKAKADLDSYKWKMIAAHGSLLNPYVKLGYTAARTNAHIDNASAMGFPKRTDSFGVELGLTISFDGMIPWSKNGLNLWAQRDGYKLQKDGLEQTRLKTQISIINYANQLNLLQDSVKLVEQNVELSRESLRLTRIGYNQGLKDLSALQTAIKDNQSAEANLMTTKLGYYSTLSNLSATIGISLEELMDLASAALGNNGPLE